MEILELIRPIKDTNTFKKNQKCWVIFKTGQLACHVKGKYKGKGRYIHGYLHAPKQIDWNSFKEIEVSDEFYKRIIVG